MIKYYSSSSLLGSLYWIFRGMSKAIILVSSCINHEALNWKSLLKMGGSIFSSTIASWKS